MPLRCRDGIAALSQQATLDRVSIQDATSIVDDTHVDDE